MSKKFQKNIEDFICEKCEAEVSGNGFTNHCPRCLWSKHVDINPGDREAKCGGMMEPVQVEKEGKDFVLTNRCKTCFHEKRNKISPRDNFEEVLKVTKQTTGKFLA